MKRRTFVAGIAAVMAARGAEAQQGARTHRVGLLTLNPRSSGSAAAVLDSLRQGFKEMGYREGENLVLEPRFAEGNRDLLPALMQELLNLQSAVIVTFGTPATVAARNATTIVPIVFIGVGDPVGSGFASSLRRPGGNLTGFSFVGPELAAKNLEFLKHAFPEVSEVAVFIPGGPELEPLARAVWGALEQAARVIHVTLQRFQIQDKVEHLDHALGALGARRPDALLTLNHP